MDRIVDAFIKRTKLKEIPPTSLMGLNQLFQAQIENIPFENIDSLCGAGIPLNIQSIANKLLHQPRGGYCYELNGLFYHLICHLGFNAKMFNATLFKENGQIIENSSHSVILVEVDGKTYFIDTGWGDEYGQDWPITFEMNCEQPQHHNTFKFQQLDNHYVLSCKNRDGSFKNILQFELEAVQLEAFNQRHLYHLSSPDSIFRKSLLCGIRKNKDIYYLKNNQLTIFGKTPSTQNLERFDTLLEMLNRDFYTALEDKQRQAFKSTWESQFSHKMVLSREGESQQSVF